MTANKTTIYNASRLNIKMTSTYRHKAGFSLFHKALSALILCFLFLVCSTGAYANCSTVNPSFTATPLSVCGTTPTNISFTNTSTGVNAGTAGYTWYHNGVSFASTSGLTAPATFPVSTVGTHVFMLIVSDPTVPCSDTVTVNVIVRPQPIAGFTFTPNNACAGTSVAFTNTSTGTIAGTTYSWNFGDGTPVSTAANPNHSFAAGGSYNVTLTVTNAAGCTSTFSSTVTALAIPAVNITGDDGDGNTTNCLLPADPTTAETVTFTNTTTGAVSYAWNFGDGGTSTAASPSHTYTSFGTYTVTMTATGANGCTATSTITVVFEKYVSSSLTLNITEYSGCAPHTLSTLTNLSVNANTYTWNFGDGSPPVTTTSFSPPSHVYTTGGTYTITLTAANSCNTATATISPIIIVAGPVANFNPSTSLGCAPQNITFTNSTTGASPANNYQWNMGNGNTYTNTATPPMQTYPTQGTYTVTMIAGNACGHDTIVRTIVIDSLPVAEITSNPLVGCTPLVVSTVNSSYGNSLTYNWFVDGFYAGSGVNLPNQTFTAPAGNTPQTHTIQLNVSNHCGTDSDAESIVVHPQVVAQFTNGPLTFCAGGSLTFTSNSLGDMLTYNWNFGEGTTSTTQGPHTIPYNTPGTYTVTLTVTGFCGTSTLSKTVTVLPYPVASFTPSVTSGCAPLVVNFTNTSTVGATSYSWTFGAGSAPASSALYTPPAITYSTPGTSNVTLTVNASGCISTATAPITINPLPVNTFNITPNNGCSPLSVTFNNTSPVVAGNTYAWDFGNGNTSVAQNPPGQTYLNATAADIIYNVQLVITTASGCSTTVSHPVTVHPLPVAAFTPLPDTVCSTTPVAFLNNSTGATTYSWNFGDGTPVSTAMSPSHPFTAAGTYTVQLIANTPFGCKDTITHTVFVDPIPTADFSFTTECVGDSTQFTDLSTGGITNWQWNFGDATSSTLTNPAHLYATSGNYNVVLTVTNTAGCTHSQSRLVTVNSVPVANFTGPPTCLGQPTAFTDVSTGTPVNWLWDFGDGSPTTNVHHPTHTYAAIGTYTIQMIAYGGSGCSDTVSHTITVTPIPTAAFTFTSVCTHDTTFFNSTSLGGPDTFTWNFGDGSPVDNTNNPSPFHLYHTPGTYTVTLTAGYAASGCTNTITHSVTAHPRTAPAFSSNTPCLGAATNFTDLTTNTPIQWEWDFGDGSPVNNTQNPVHTYTAPGFYTITLITSNVFSCTDSMSATIQVFPLPTAGFSYDTVCANFASTFADNSISAVSWQWNFGDGSPLNTNASPSHIFPANGTYVVTQIVTNNVGCTDTVGHTITVNPNPLAAFNVSTACHTYPSFFTDASTGAVAWAWDFGDGATDNVQDPDHTYPLDGNYTTQLIVTNIFGCTDTIQQTATVLLQPQSAFSNTTVCAGQNVVFTDNTTGMPTTWLWDFGDGTPTAAVQNPNHVYALGGSYNITLITGNLAGCMDTLVQAINVFTVPVPDFTVDTVCLFSITHFTDLSTDAALITDWYWDFGDGNNSFAQSPTYIFQSAGTFNVTLTVTNVNGCDSSIVLPVIVNEIPVADFSADTACVGGPTSFTDLSTGAPTSWLWNFGDGTTSTSGPNVAHTYAVAGSYVVTLYVTGGAGTCYDQVFEIVNVTNTVTAGFTAEDTACAREVIPFTNTSFTSSGTISGYDWDFGDGQTSTATDPTHAFDMPGTYTVTLIASQTGGCSNVFTQDILVVANPTAMFVTGAACLNQVVNFNSMSVASGTPLSSLNWNFGDGNTGTGTNVSHTYGTAGTFNVELDITSIVGCHDSIIVPIVINPLPVADFSNNVVCLGDTVVFDDLSTISSGSISTWNWDFGDGGTSILSEPQHLYTSHNDTFTVSLIVVSDMGCSDTSIQDVLTLPIVDFNFGPEVVNGCAPLLIYFGDQSTISGGSSIVGWVWNFDDGNFSFQQSPQHVYPDAGAYFVSLAVTTSDGCVYSDTLSYPITVYPQPVAGFDVDPVSTSVFTPEVSFPDLSTGALYWEYSFGDNNYSNEQSPSHYYTAPGTYNVMQIVTNGYGCSDTTVHPVYILEESTFFAPNAVSPNGDGINEFFLPEGTGIVEYKLYVFDRWGELLFTSTDILQGWDCTFKGVTVKEDVYVWRAIITDLNGDVQDYYGHFTVIR